MNRSLCHNSGNARNSRFQSGPMFTFAIAISLERHGKNISRQDFTIMARTFTMIMVIFLLRASTVVNNKLAKPCLEIFI